MTATEPVVPEITIPTHQEMSEEDTPHSSLARTHFQSPVQRPASSGTRAATERPFSCHITLPSTQPRITWNKDSKDPSNPDSPIQCRVVQDRRTVLITSYIPPEQWDTKTLQHISRLAEFPSDPNDRPQPLIQIGSPSSKANSEESSSKVARAPPHAQRSQSYGKDHRQRQGSLSSTEGEAYEVNHDSHPDTPQTTYQQSQRKRGKAKPIYFYDKNDPYYGFTNFSSHKVMYKGKEYPTSEHLFQSFKVSRNVLL